MPLLTNYSFCKISQPSYNLDPLINAVQEGKIGFEELEKHALEAGEPPIVSGKQVQFSFSALH